MKKLIVGMGRSGIETALFLTKHNISFDTFDDLKDRDSVCGALSCTSFQHFSSVAGLRLTDYRDIIVSPGVSATHPLLAQAQRLGLPICSELEFAFRQAKGKIVAVTGSNGKSTTVSLIHHLLQENGVPAVCCGNIGEPFIACVHQADSGLVYVVEVSSFQLEHIQRFSPDIGVLLNLSPDHLDRHGSFEAYVTAKLSMFQNQSLQQLALFPHNWSAKIPGRARKWDLPNQNAFLQGETIQVNQEPVSLKPLTLLGSHNRENALYATVVARTLGLSSSQIEAAFASFRGLEHRMETIGSCRGQLWINDTKATNICAAQAAIDAMDRPYVLILGGSGKGERFTALDFGTKPPKAIIAYGESAPLICQDLAAFHPLHVPLFKDACLVAHREASQDCAVLLAPACASFDQFSNFKERGRAFKSLFKQLAGAA